MKRWLWVVLFAITMAYFEDSVVVYLRALAYPEGFSFPLSPIPASITLTELGREAASLITYDVLFLIPVVWSGLVIAPVTVSIASIVLGRLLFLIGLCFFGGAIRILYIKNSI